MGIQPIDLQIMYSQAANAAKAATGAQASAQLSQSMHQSTVVQQNLENSTKVHALNNEQSKSNAVSDKGGGNGGGAYGSSGNKSENEEPQGEENNFYPKPRLKESYLGNIIDIQG